MSGPSLSFVIPVLNEAGRIVELLAMLQRDFPGAQRIVVDGGSRDATVAAAMPGATQLLLGEAGRAAQMNLGARAASGDYLLFLHADSRPRFTTAALSRVLAVAPEWGFFPLRLDSRKAVFRLLERAISLRSRYSGIGTGDQMLFLRRDLFLACGGFAPIPLMEDVELCKRLRRTAAPLVPDLAVETSSRRWEQRGVLRTVLQMWGLRLAYALGVAPERLRRIYYGPRG
ncbi:TIGR04283 family arsenosugar biosynthesis glycosyltransferase [Haliea sp. E1-2-M8]|uniref:TIGR04283 family arsenosugar biosynthesis glycosyltransferase n=1 Tax=Haliea sp. E1-2-M8 TaxID=3064706 RepID=UPI00271D9051|nr:TIGR04283 family arsenosugar biosynthesis glycosyltransferase [Haliea sp. E1-2-M8]MDO8862830.1 TIGR04283 family arsenosugar biosynthesis glycosyltransferase [Haliea sp. E1-2-M8]